MSGFSTLDWLVVLGVLVLTTVVGERLSRKHGTLRDFFLGGRSLPWYAVAASLVATEISAVTFVGLPFVVWREGGDLTYLQIAALGSFFARAIVAVWLVPAYYEREVYSPYDYMGRKLGSGVRVTATWLFGVGGVLAQSARVYLTAVVLEVVLHRELAGIEAATGIPPLVAAVSVIGVFAVLWTWIGGIATVVWTDTVLFLVFLAGLAIALATLGADVDGGLPAIWSTAREAGKLRFLDLGGDLSRPYTFWVAVIAAPWWFAGVFGTDQLFAQRILCCKDVRAARLAVMASQVSVVVTALAMAVGLGLYAFYLQQPLAGEALTLVQDKGDRVFPVFVLEHVPSGLRGVLLAGVFAAAISSLDSIMAALSQTTLAATWLAWRRRALGLGDDERLPESDERRSVRYSRVLVLVFGVLLCALAVGVRAVHDSYPSIFDMALAMAGYTQGALLAGVVLALTGRRDGSGFVWAAPVSMLAVFSVAWHGEVARNISMGAALTLLALFLVRRPQTRKTALQASGLVVALALCLVLSREAHAADASGATVRVLAYPWYVPLGSSVAFALAWLLGRPSRS